MKNIIILSIFFALTSGCKDKDPIQSVKINHESFFDTSLVSTDWLVDSVKLARMDTLASVSTDMKAVFVYADKSPVNLADFSKFDLKLKKDGSFVQTDTDGSKSSGKWHLIDSETTLRLENSDTQLIEHYNISKLDSASFGFNVEIPKDRVFESLHKTWQSRLMGVYGPMVSNHPLIVMFRMRR